MEHRTIVPQKCKCESGLYCDRIIDGKMRCPGDDPELGVTPEHRLANYKLLITHPVPTTFLKLWGNDGMDLNPPKDL